MSTQKVSALLVELERKLDKRQDEIQKQIVDLQLFADELSNTENEVSRALTNLENNEPINGVCMLTACHYVKQDRTELGSFLAELSREKVGSVTAYDHQIGQFRDFHRVVVTK